MLRVMLRVIVAVVVVSAVGLGGGLLWLSTSLPDSEGTLAVAGLESTVRIRRDARGVPHIQAAGAGDAYFALGFVHAQDRLWQMETMRRLGTGRLAEVAGPKALASDRFMRTLGFHRLAERQYEDLEPVLRRALESYSAGVNAWLDGHRGALPPEFYLLRLAPEPWHPVDSLLWGKIMAFTLSGNWRDELLRAALADRLDAARIEELWPPFPGDGPLTAGDSGAADTAAYTSGPALDFLAASGLAPTGRPRGASNAWVVAGRRTASGKPLLANDPHLGFKVPIIWYLAVIEAPGLEVAGATVPGFPFTVLGHNRRIAWGMTSTQSDLQDLYRERVDPRDESRYLTPDGPRRFQTREETIVVRGAEDEVLTVRETRHGPVISDLPGGGDGVLALAATFSLPDDRTPGALYRLNRARDWDSFVAALEDFHAPQMNFLYADVAGNIGFLAPGRVPVRKRGRGRRPRPGWNGDFDWVGEIPFAALPRSLNPPAGRIVSANNRIVGDDYPYFIGDDWAPGYRARRILDLLDGETPLTVASMAAGQSDHRSEMARDLLPMMLDVEPVTDRQRRALALVARWDGTMSRRRPEPLIFTAWLGELNRAVYADELGDLFESYRSLRPRFIASVLERRRRWCDDIATTTVREDCADRLRLSLERALERLSKRLGEDMAKWRWGDVHQARFRHPMLSGVPLLGGFADLAIATDGGDYTLSRGATRSGDRERPFEHVHGAGLRAIYDLSDLQRSRFMIATGQSGNPLSGHYRDLLEEWRDGRYMVLGATGARELLVLVPADPG